jgi:hypothetical protein
MDYIAFHRSSAVAETVNDSISVFFDVWSNTAEIGPPNRPLALETNEYDTASAAMPADSNMTATAHKHLTRWS